jgi:hypothetical protein
MLVYVIANNCDSINTTKPISIIYTITDLPERFKLILLSYLHVLVIPYFKEYL